MEEVAVDETLGRGNRRKEKLKFSSGSGLELTSSDS